MKKIIIVAAVMMMLFCVPVAQAFTKVVGFEDKVIIFFDKNNDGKPELIKLIVTDTAAKVITMEEAKEIIATFPEEVRK